METFKNDLRGVVKISGFDVYSDDGWGNKDVKHILELYKKVSNGIFLE